jgi:ectoine hydroxylase
MADSDVDLYPSRSASTPVLLSRRDPVVFGSAESGPLSATLLGRYEQDGYLFFESLFTATQVKSVLAAVDGLRDSPTILSREEAIREPGGGGLRSIFRVHALHQTLAELVGDGRLVSIAEQILGSEVYVHQSRVNFKPPFVGKEFYWHSDFETWHVEDGLPHMRAISFAINLTPSNEFNGPLLVIPESHRRFVACVGETPERHYQESLRRQRYGVPDEESLRELVSSTGIVAPKGDAGSAVLFDSNLMHGSGSNISPYPRCTLFVVYNSVNNAPRAPYGGQPARPEFIAERDTSPVRLRC